MSDTNADIRIDTSIRAYYPALLMDELWPRRLRARLRTLFLALAVLSLAGYLAGAAYAPIARYATLFEGVLCISLGLALALSLIAAFYRSYYFRDAVSAIPEPGLASPQPMTYDAASIVFGTDPVDATLGFARSGFGYQLFTRLGISFPSLTGFLASRASRTALDTLSFPEKENITGAAYARALYAADKELQTFLFAAEIGEKDLVGAAEWISEARGRGKRGERSWSRENLGRIPGIGKAWAYGQTGHLEKFAEELSGGIDPRTSGVLKETEALESALSKARGANALIVSDGGGMDAVYGLLELIESGKAFPALEGKRVMRFDTASLIDAAGEKTVFEEEFARAMNEALSAGKIIVLFEDLPVFMRSAETIGTDAAALLQPYLASSRGMVIATVDTGSFHSSIENRPALFRGFDIVRVAEKDDAALVASLTHLVPAAESRTGAFFTYPALEALADGAARFFADQGASEKARDLLFELAASAARQSGQKGGERTIGKAEALAFLETKTGVPQEGNIADAEAQKLDQLESLLHARVIGQDEAVTAVANAMRRARAGVRAEGKPIGSFLFLGPTGVGKTETAKALGDIYFGGGAPFIRFDMSEYAGPDALERLIGTSSRPGLLASTVRDKKYGILLLDEFEKTTKDVMNLFLQILDEGFFSDATGKRVNMRELIIIATSNAGSDEIFALEKEGRDLAASKSAFVEQLVKSGLYAPELLNRFDGVILFHPLDSASLKEIARLMVGHLAERLRSQGVLLEPTDDLFNYLAEKGYDPQFGARPMNRVLQDDVEKLIAEKLIRKEVKKGGAVSLYRDAGTGALSIRTR